MVTTIRAPLFVPANRPQRFAKAVASGAGPLVTVRITARGRPCHETRDGCWHGVKFAQDRGQC